MRVGGLASGMDIDALVEKLMQAERVPLDRTFQQKQKYEWQRDAYRGINTKMSTMHTYMLDKMTMSTSLKPSVASSSNDKLVAVGSSGGSGQLTIESVSQLAKSARAVGTVSQTTNGETATKSTKLSELGIEPGSISFKAITKDGELADKYTEINIHGNMTIDNLISNINNSNAGVTALFEGGKLSITAKNTGTTQDGNDIVFKNDSNSLATMEKLGLYTPTGSETAENITVGASGQNAKFTINGIEAERTSNNFVVSGFDITLKETFNKPGDINQVKPIELSSRVDTKAMKTQIEDFVTKYNELVDSLTSQMKEKSYRDFPPLTDAQRKDMSEEEQKQWDEKAKSGLLRNDSILRDSLSKMREALLGTVGGLDDSSMNTLAKIGITTTKNYNDGGKLEINHDKLDAALAKDPDQVYKLFAQQGEVKTNPDGTKTDTRGISERLRVAMKSTIDDIERKAGKTTSTNEDFTLGKKIKASNKRMDELQAKLKDIEARYWKQFTAMEKAIQKANEQAGMFAQVGQ